MPSDYIIVESSGTPLLEQVMVFVIKTIGKSTSEITSILSSLPSAAMGGSVGMAHGAKSAAMRADCPQAERLVNTSKSSPLLTAMPRGKPRIQRLLPTAQI